MTYEELQKLHAMVWDFRREMEPYFPTPNQADSLAFAFTEIAEAVDATLRQNPLYKRNQDKAHMVEREMAQTALMLLTAIPEGWDRWGYHVKNWRNLTLPKVAVAVGVIYNDVPDVSLYEMRDVVLAISHFIDLPTELAAELDRMRAKHLPKPPQDWRAEYPQQAERLTLIDYREGDGL